MTVLAAGGVVYRQGSGDIEVVAVVPQRELQRWGLPKGHQEPGETLPQTALREVQEETGLEVRITGDLGFVEYTFAQGATLVHKQVYYYLMTTHGGDFGKRDHEMAQVIWLSLVQAISQMTFSTEREILERARCVLLPEKM